MSSLLPYMLLKHDAPFIATILFTLGVGFIIIGLIIVGLFKLVLDWIKAQMKKKK